MRRRRKSNVRRRWGSAGGERRSDEAVGAVVQHATVPSAREMRDEAVGAVVQQATVLCTQCERDERRGDGCSCVACNCTQSVEQQCASTETVGFGPCIRDWGLRLAEHALACHS